MLSASSPFYIKPRLDLDLIKWGLTFWRRSARSTMEKNIPPLNEILHLSRTLTSEIRNDFKVKIILICQEYIDNYNKIYYNNTVQKIINTNDSVKLSLYKK